MRPTEMAKAALASRKKREFDAPPWFPIFLPVGIAALALYIGYGVLSGPSDEPAAPADTNPVASAGPASGSVLPAPEVVQDREQPVMPESYYIAMTAAANHLLSGDPGLPTMSGTPLPRAPEWVRGTFSYDRADLSEEDAGSYWFSFELAEGGRGTLQLYVYNDGRRWMIRD